MLESRGFIKIDNRIENFFGAFLKRIRKIKEINLEQLSSMTHLSKSVLSEYERHEKPLDAERFKFLCQYLQVDLQTSEELFDEVSSIFNSFIWAQIYMDREFRNQCVADLKRLEKQAEHSLAYPCYALMMFIYLVSTQQSYHEIRGFHNDVLQFENYYSFEQKQLLYQYVGVLLKDKKAYEESLDYLDKALMMSQKHKPIIGMIYYHISMVHDNRSYLLEALECNKKAKEIFDVTGNFVRVGYAETEMATIYARLGEFKMAIERFKNNIQRMYAISKNRDLGVIYHNLAWTYLKAEEYDEVINWVNKTMMLGSNHLMLYFYNAWSYYKLSNETMSHYWIDKGLATKQTQYIVALKLLRFTRAMMQTGYTSKARKYLEDAYSYMLRGYDFEMVEFVLKLLFRSSISIEDYQNASRYAAALIDYQEKLKC